MNKKLLLILLILIPILANHIYSEVLTIRADIWLPYNGNPKEKTNIGYAIEIVQEVFESNDIDIDYDILPWARAVENTRKGKFNAVIGAYVNDVPDFVFPDEEIGIGKNSFFKLPENTWEYNGLNSLQTETLGAINAYSYSKELDEYINNNSNNSKLVEIISGNDALKRNVKKLLNNRISIIIEDENVMHYLLKQLNLENRIVKAGNLSKDKIFVAFSPNIKNSKKYAQILSDGIQKMRKSGRLKEIMKKYDLDDWK